jgi:hypothetical protein
MRSFGGRGGGFQGSWASMAAVGGLRRRRDLRLEEREKKKKEIKRKKRNERERESRFTEKKIF